MDYKEASKQPRETEPNYEVMLQQAEDIKDRLSHSFVTSWSIPPSVCNINDLIELLRAHIELTTALMAKTEEDERQDYQDEMDRDTLETIRDNRYAGAPY